MQFLILGNDVNKTLQSLSRFLRFAKVFQQRSEQLDGVGVAAADL